MTQAELKNMIINIETLSEKISCQHGPAIVAAVFERYGAHSVEDLNPHYLSDVFSELYFIESDMN